MKMPKLLAVLLVAAGALWYAPAPAPAESFQPHRQPQHPHRQPQHPQDHPHYRPRVTILMFSTPNILPYASLAAEINEAYARRHGYGFVHEVQGVTARADAPWKMVELIRTHLATSDAVMFMDSDAAFNIHSQSLEFLFGVPGHIVGCSDAPNGPNFINTGALFVRNTPKGRSLTDAWWLLKTSSPKYLTFAYEQQALHDLAERTPPGQIVALPAETFNSVFAHIKRGKRDTFVLHFMAHDTPSRIRELQRMKESLLH